MPPFLEVVDVYKSYYLHGKRIDVLNGVSLTIERGEMVSLVGASGSGKSTFLHVVGTLDAPAAGVMRYQGKSVFDMNDAEVAEFRNKSASASCFKATTCCPSSPRPRTSRCRR